VSQLDLFAGSIQAPASVEPAPIGSELAMLAGRLPAGVHLGTSSWTFPGWAGIVYARQYREPVLAREGLSAYALHPLLNVVGLDRAFYAPPTTAQFRELAACVPSRFLFVVKAYAGLTMPASLRARHGYRRHPSGADPFLDSDFATRQVVEPFAEGLGSKGGSLVFQFPPLPAEVVRKPASFCGRLRDFLAALPRGLPYAVEIRNPELLCAAYADALAASGAVHAYTVHPSMSSLQSQQALCGDLFRRGPLVVRWMLGHGRRYEEARQRYAPFGRMVDPDPASRSEIARWVLEASRVGRTACVIVNNKAEGSAPLSVLELAREIDRRRA
jgi:uncharacterized protein YecE (DUF72 family)